MTTTLEEALATAYFSTSPNLQPMKSNYFLAVSALCIAFAACDNASEKPKAEAPQSSEAETSTTYQYDSTQYQGFPSGYGYLTESKQIEQAIAEKKQGPVRTHGWKIWAGIMQPASGIAWPVWYTWPNTYDAFVNPPSSHTVGAGASGKMAKEQNTMSLIERNAHHVPSFTDTAFVDTQNVNIQSVPYYPVPDIVKQKYPGAVSGNNISTGPHFMSNGDIMIPTESYTMGGYDWIVDNDLYKASKLTELFNAGTKSLDAPETYVVTKHMFWPVAGDKPSVIPVWDPSKFDLTSPAYNGYETWQTFTALDPSGQDPVGSTVTAKYLFDVYACKNCEALLGPKEITATVSSMGDFYHHQVTQTDWDSFTDADKAILSAASYWAYGRAFQVGDYLVTIAMHINTKEVATWALQSVWWTNKPGATKYSTDQPDLPQASGPWKHYDLVAEYGILDPATGELPIAFNPYIEPVIHPLATNCRNCHMRAGWPAGSTAGKASYQNPDCKNLLQPLTPESECLKQYMLTDMQWVIPDHAH